MAGSDHRPGFQALRPGDFIYEELDAILLGADDLDQLPNQRGIFGFRDLGQGDGLGYILPTGQPICPVLLRSYGISSRSALE